MLCMGGRLACRLWIECPRINLGGLPWLQVVFAVLYLATQGVVMLIYAQTRAVPPWSLALLCLSRRLHSIYLLRLFNDCWAMFIAYCATALLQVLGSRCSRRFWVMPSVTTCALCVLVCSAADGWPQSWPTALPCLSR